MNDCADGAELLADGADQRLDMRRIGEVGGEYVACGNGGVRAMAQQQGAFAVALQLVGERGSDAGFVIGDQADAPGIVLRLGRAAGLVDRGQDEARDLGRGDRGRQAEACPTYRSGDTVGDFTQGAGAGELIHHALDLGLLGRGDALLQSGEDLDAFDGVDAQIGFDAGIQAEHVGFVAGAFAGDFDQVGQVAVPGGCGWGDGRGNGWSYGASDEVGDFTQGAGAGEFVHDALHALLLGGRAEFLQGGQDFDALDGVDAQVGFDAGVEVEHLRRVAGALGGYGAQFGDEVARGTAP